MQNCATTAHGDGNAWTQSANTPHASKFDSSVSLSLWRAQK
jgi:hypothetical protein